MPYYPSNIVVPEGRIKTGSTYSYMIPGVETIAGGTVALTANQIRYEPFIVNSTITLDQLICEITTNSAGGTTVRVGIYAANTDWQPTTLIVDAGTLDASANAIKIA